MFAHGCGVRACTGVELRYTTAPMRLAPLLSSALVLGSLTAIASAPSIGCTGSTDEEVGAAEQAATVQDLRIAKEVISLLGGENGHCKNCHQITPTRLRAWGNTMKDVDDACFAPGNLTPTERVNCLRSTPTNPSSNFSARRLGLYAAGASGDAFKDLFESAFPAATWTAEFATFAQRAAMPRSGTALTAAEFAKLKDWVLRGMPQLDEAFAAGDAGPDASDIDAPAPPTCTPKTTPELAAHLAAMKTQGWGARLADEATPMFGCGNAATPLGCLTQLPDVTQTFGANGINQKLRRLRKQTLSSRYWVRSSADGRYVGFGMFSSAKVVDLTKPETAPAIKVAADYDPFFLPSNDGFAFAGAHTAASIRVCRQSLLADVSTQPSPSISLTEPKCAALDDEIYQSIGTALDGSRYLATWGAHENDDGGNIDTAPLPAAFAEDAATTFTPMVNDGQAYRAQPPVSVSHPGEGDMMLSPSTLAASTRFGDGTKQKGYRIRLIKTQPKSTSDGGTTLDITAPVAAEICMPGAKASFSFDERFLVTHQYVDRSEPDQVNLPEGSSNIMLADLSTGRQLRLTSSKANVYALYPHFRADGWLYFIVRDMDANLEYVVASDAALRLAQQ